MEPSFVGVDMETVPSGSMEGGFVWPHRNGAAGVWISPFLRENIPEVCGGEGGCLNLDQILTPCLISTIPKCVTPGWGSGWIPTLLPPGFREVRECPAEGIPYSSFN